MKYNKGFMGVGVIIAIIVALAVGGGVVYYTTKTPAPSSNTEENNYQPQTNQNQQQTNTQTPPVNSSEPCTRNGSMGTYKCQYPVLKVNGSEELNLNQLGTWTVNAYSPNDKGEGSTLIYSVKWGDVAGEPKFGKEYPPFTHAYSQFGTYTLVFTAKDSTGAQTTTSTTVSVINSTSAGAGATSAITSVSPLATKIGDTVLVKGYGFRGFEGDVDLSIENSSGIKALVCYSNGVEANPCGFAGNMNDDGNISFVLASKYCSVKNYQISTDCQSFMNIVPGKYSLYVSPWGKASNKVYFTVTSSISTYTYKNHGFSIELPKGFIPKEEQSEGGPALMISLPVGGLAYVSDASFWERYNIPNYTYVKDQKIGDTTFKVYTAQGSNLYWYKIGNVGYEFSVQKFGTTTDTTGLENLLKTFKFIGWSQN